MFLMDRETFSPPLKVVTTVIEKLDTFMLQSVTAGERLQATRRFLAVGRLSANVT
jgi:hypothetical protein